jgi:F-type H+-transporting ATPase subunit epsilon
MAAHLLQLTIASVAKPIFNGIVRSVTLPGAEGDVTIMANHEAFVTILKEGKIFVRKEDGSHEEFLIEHGALEVADNHATVLL